MEPIRRFNSQRICSRRAHLTRPPHAPIALSGVRPATSSHRSARASAAAIRARWGWTDRGARGLKLRNREIIGRGGCDWRQAVACVVAGVSPGQMVGPFQINAVSQSMHQMRNCHASGARSRHASYLVNADLLPWTCDPSIAAGLQFIVVPA